MQSILYTHVIVLNIRINSPWDDILQIPAGLPNGYPTQNLVPRPFVPEQNFLFLTAYFVDPSKTFDI